MGSRRSFGMLLRVSALCAVVDIAAGQTERQPTSNSPRPRGERQWPSLPPVLIQSENWPKPNSWKRSGVLQAGEHGSYDGAVGTDSKIYLVPRGFTKNQTEDANDSNQTFGVRLRMLIVTVSPDGHDLTWKERPFNLPSYTDLTKLSSGWNAVHATQYHIEHYIIAVPTNSGPVLRYDYSNDVLKASQALKGGWYGVFDTTTGLVFGVPSQQSTTNAVLLYDPDTNAADETTIIIQASYGDMKRRTRRWVDGCYSPVTKKIYGIPENYNAMLVIDPSTLSAEVISISGIRLGQQGYSWWGGAFVPSTGKIYGVPCRGSAALIVDPSTNSTDTATLGRFDPHFYGKWKHGTVADDGKLYGIPANSDSVLIIDPTTNTTDVTTLSGLGTCSYKDGRGATQKYCYKWYDSVFHPATGNIYALPAWHVGEQSESILIIKPSSACQKTACPTSTAKTETSTSTTLTSVTATTQKVTKSTAARTASRTTARTAARTTNTKTTLTTTTSTTSFTATTAATVSSTSTKTRSTSSSTSLSTSSSTSSSSSSPSSTTAATTTSTTTAASTKASPTTASSSSSSSTSTSTTTASSTTTQTTTTTTPTTTPTTPTTPVQLTVSSEAIEEEEENANEVSTARTSTPAATSLSAAAATTTTTTNLTRATMTTLTTLTMTTGTSATVTQQPIGSETTTTETTTETTLYCNEETPCGRISDACCRASDRCRFKRFGDIDDGYYTGMLFMICVDQTEDDDDYTYGDKEEPDPNATTVLTSTPTTSFTSKMTTSSSTVKTSTQNPTVVLAAVPTPPQKPSQTSDAMEADLLREISNDNPFKGYAYDDGEDTELGKIEKELELHLWLDNVDQQHDDAENTPTPIPSLTLPSEKAFETTSVVVIIVATCVVLAIIFAATLAVFGPCACRCCCTTRSPARANVVTAFENPLFGAVGSLVGDVDRDDDDFYMDVAGGNDKDKTRNLSVLVNDTYVDTLQQPQPDAALQSSSLVVSPTATMVLLCTESEEDV